MEQDKMYPQVLDVEEAVLGAFIIDSSIMKNFAHVIKPEVFYKTAHETIMKAIFQLHHKDTPIDLLTVVSELTLMGKLAEVGGAYYIATLTNRVASAHHIEYHIRILWQVYIFREIITICEETKLVAFKQNEDVFELLEKTLERLEKLDVTKKQTIIKKLSDHLEKVLEETAENSTLFYPAGIQYFDEVLNFGPNNLTLVGGKSGGGNYVLFNIIVYICKNYKLQCPHKKLYKNIRQQ